MSYPSFAAGDILNASDMNAVGLWLVKSQAVGSGVSSVSVTSAFLSSYDNYRVQYVGGTGTANAVMQFNFTGTNGQTGFYGNLFYANFTSGTALTFGNNNSTAVTHAGGNANGSWNVNLEIAAPFLAARSFISGPFVDSGNAGTMTAFHNFATSYTGFTLTPSAGTLTGGTIYVYGYRK